MSTVAADAKSYRPELVLYQYEVCPFCCKVKAFLDFHRLPYRTVEVNPVRQDEIQFSEYKKVPILMIDGVAHTESSEIMKHLQAKVGGPSAPTPEEDKWLQWVDERLVHVLTVNIYRTPGESWQAFEYLTTHANFSPFQTAYCRVFGSVLMYLISKRIKKRHDYGEEREELRKAAAEWAAGLAGRGAMGGSAGSANLADLAAFGVMRSIKELPSFAELMTDPTVRAWYDTLAGAVGPSSRLPAAEPR